MTDSGRAGGKEAFGRYRRCRASRKRKQPENPTSSGEQKSEPVQVVSRKLSGFNFESIAPVSVAQPLEHISTTAQQSRFPLFHDVEILVYHQRWITEEIFRGSSQVDASAPGRSKRVPVQTRNERVFNNLDMLDVIAEKFYQCRSHRLWQRCAPTHKPFYSAARDVGHPLEVDAEWASMTGPIDVFVVDHAEKVPADN